MLNMITINYYHMGKLTKRSLKLRKVCKYITGDGDEFNKKSAAKRHVKSMKAKLQKKRKK